MRYPFIEERPSFFAGRSLFITGASAGQFSSRKARTVSRSPFSRAVVSTPFACIFVIISCMRYPFIEERPSFFAGRSSFIAGASAGQFSCRKARTASRSPFSRAISRAVVSTPFACIFSRATWAPLPSFIIPPRPAPLPAPIGAAIAAQTQSTARPASASANLLLFFISSPVFLGPGRQWNTPRTSEHKIHAKGYKCIKWKSENDATKRFNTGTVFFLVNRWTRRFVHRLSGHTLLPQDTP